MVFIDVIVPVPLSTLFTYLVEDEFIKDVEVGKRVVVKFGRNKLYTAIIHSIHTNPPRGYQAKAINFVLDEFPIVDVVQLKFWDWISNYYVLFSNVSYPYVLALNSSNATCRHGCAHTNPLEPI